MLKPTVLVFLCFWSIEFGLGKTSQVSVGHSANNFEPDTDPYENRRGPARPLFNYHNHGVKIDIRVVPAINDSIVDKEDRFPEFPARDLGQCVMDLSMSCFRDRVARFIEAIGRLDVIPLYGSGIKLVKTRAMRRKNGERRMMEIPGDGDVEKIDRSIDDFFDSFALRISLPRPNGRRERNQIDVMFDDNEVAEGRGKKGGGGGGGKGGGKCKKMMMTMLMMAKMKLMGMAGMMSMKGMMMAGMSLMISKAMLLMKLMSLKMGGGGGGGGGGYGGGGGGGGQLKEIVLLTKASGGGGGGGGAPSDSYGAPPPSSYGPPSSGGGGYDYSGGGGGGGGWGRSFDNRLSMSYKNEQPQTFYSRNVNPITKNIDPVVPSRSDNDTISTNRTIAFNNSSSWRSKKSWNSNDFYEGSKLNDSRNFDQYDSKNDEFEVIREKTSDIDDRIDKHGTTVVRTIYANKWKNYEAADRILHPGTPMVAVRRTISRGGRASKSIPIMMA